MEEQHIKDIVHRASVDEAFRHDLVSNTEGVIEREGLSPRVAEVVTKLVPHLEFGFKPVILQTVWWAFG